MKNLILSNGVEIPAIGFGSAMLDGHADSIKTIITNAITAGYRLVDTAYVYGSEEQIGQAVRELILSGKISRKELSIQSKLSPEKHGYYSTLESFDESLNKMQMDYLDIFLIHWPVPRYNEECYREKNVESWQAIEELYKKGKIRAIGVCNFLERHLMDIMDNCSIHPMINQLEIHPQFQQRGLVRFCRERNITVEGWKPFWGGKILEVSEVQDIAEEYGRSAAQLCIRWSIQKNIIPLPRSSDKDRLQQNLDVFDFEISDENMKRLDALNTDTCYSDMWAYKRQRMY